jgi:hypothetical protein
MRLRMGMLWKGKKTLCFRMTLVFYLCYMVPFSYRKREKDMISQSQNTK